MASSVPIHRGTFFKVKEDADVEGMLEKYGEMKAAARKDDKPYILTLSAGRLHPDPRSGDYNLGVFATYASLDDMRYYDDSCAAHAALKAWAKGKVGGPPMVVYFEDGVGGSGGFLPVQ